MVACWILRWGLRRAPFAFSFHFVPLSPARPAHGFFSPSSCNVHNRDNQYGVWRNLERQVSMQYSFHKSCPLSSVSSMLQAQKTAEDVVSLDDSDGRPKVKRKKLKGRRAVVKFLKFLRWKTKKDYDRMTAEEKILFKLRKARKKEDRIVEALKKIEPPDPSGAQVTHDPEILTPEEHFYFLKMGNKCKNYVPVGRRGIFQGVILNMHLHWKKHQTLKVVVKTFTPEEVREIAAELARLSGGIVLDIVDDDTIIMYRGRNYSQPPTEIMSPRITLSRKKALDKSKYRDALQAVHRFIPRLEQDLDDLHEKMKKDGRNASLDEVNNLATTINAEAETGIISNVGLKSDNVHDGAKDEAIGVSGSEDKDAWDPGSFSESEDLSDIFSTDVSDSEAEGKMENPLYLDQVERFPSDHDNEPEDFEEHLRKISAASRVGDWPGKELNLSDLDEVDKIFLRAGSLLKKKQRR